MASTIAVLIGLLFSHGRAPDFPQFVLWGMAAAVLIAVTVYLLRSSGPH
jgi:hypothetical protein